MDRQADTETYRQTRRGVRVIFKRQVDRQTGKCIEMKKQRVGGGTEKNRGI